MGCKIGFGQGIGIWPRILIQWLKHIFFPTLIFFYFISIVGFFYWCSSIFPNFCLFVSIEPFFLLFRHKFDDGLYPFQAIHHPIERMAHQHLSPEITAHPLYFIPFCWNCFPAFADNFMLQLYTTTFSCISSSLIWVGILNDSMQHNNGNNAKNIVQYL